MASASEMNSNFLPESPLGVFTVEVAMPGGAGADWRPFPAQELPLAEYARQIIERFDFKAEIIELAADHDPDISRPGIILIDPRFMTMPGGRAALEAAVKGLPKWILPMLVVSQSADADTADMADQVRNILSAAGALRGRSARRGARGADSFQAFSFLVRDLMSEAERNYITHRSKQRYGAPVPSHRSAGRSGSLPPSWAGRRASAPRRQRETPDAR